MSFFYDGSGATIQFEYNTISSIVNYKFPPPNFISTISSFIITDFQTISNYIDLFGTISNFIYVPIEPYKNNISNNRFLSTYFRGFIDVDGSIICNDKLMINNINIENYIISLSGKINNTDSNSILSSNNSFTGFNNFKNLSISGDVSIYNSSIIFNEIDIINNNFGLQFQFYDGYHYENVDYAKTATKLGVNGYSNDFTNLNTATNNLPRKADNFTVEWIGYFRAIETGIYNIKINSDDGTYLWMDDDVKNDASTKPTRANATVDNGGLHAASISNNNNVSLTSGKYYFIKVLMGEEGGGEEIIIQFTNPNGVINYGNKYLYSTNNPISNKNQIISKDKFTVGFTSNFQTFSINNNSMILNNGYISLSGFILYPQTINYLNGLSSNLENQLITISGKIKNISLTPGPQGIQGNVGNTGSQGLSLILQMLY